mgnify:CR=1 FL=1
MEINNTVKFKDIETPTTVEGFRKNLMKYYVCHGRNLLLQGDMVSVDDLDCLVDLYKFNPNPMITPQVYFDIEDVTKHLMRPKYYLSFRGLYDEENPTVYLNQKKFIKSGTPSWVTVDNLFHRDFFLKTLGNFSGYEYK